MDNTYDYGLLAENLINLVEVATEKELIEDATTGPQPERPFFSYSIPSPYLPITVDIVDNEQFELVVSLKCHTDSTIQGLNLATKLRKYLTSFEGKLLLKEKDMILVSITKVGKRDNFISIEYERLTGFDVRFRVRDAYVDKVQEIENIDI